MVKSGYLELDDALASLGVRFIRKIFPFSKREGRDRFFEVGLSRDLPDIRRTAGEIGNLDEIEFVEVLPKMRAGFTPDDCLFNSTSGCYSSTWPIEQWGLFNDGKVVTAYTGEDVPPSKIGADIGAKFAWDKTKGSEEVVLAFIDTGMDWDHPEFENNIWMNPLEDRDADGVFEQSDLGDINNDGYPGVQGVDDDGDGGTDFNDPDIRNKDYDCDGTPLWGSDRIVGTADDDQGDKDIAAWDDDENGLPDDCIGWNYTRCGPGYYDPTPEEQGSIGDAHGTQIASIAAAEGDNNESAEDDKAMAGVIWESKLMTLKISNDKDNINAAAIATALDYARHHGADVVNLSFYTTTDLTTLRTAIEDAIDDGCIIVACAGNNNQNTSRTYPASYDNVIGVMGTDRQDHKSSFVPSNYNPSNAYWYDVAAPGDSLTTLLPMSHVNQPISMDDYYTLGSGTSGSTAFVTGTAALLKSLYPSLTNIDVLWQMRNMTDNLDPYLESAHVGKMGTGRINSIRTLGYGNWTKHAWIYDDHAWEQRAFVADTMVVDTSATLTWSDSLHVYCVDEDNRAGVKLIEGAELIIPDDATVVVDDSFYVEVGHDCTFRIGKRANVTFGDSCIIKAVDGGLILVDESATVTLGARSGIVVTGLSELRFMEKSTGKFGSASYINVNHATINSRGLPDNNVTLTHREGEEWWKGIFLISATQPTPSSTIYRTTISWADVGVETEIDEVSIKRSTFYYNRVGSKMLSPNAQCDSNYFVSNLDVALQAADWERTVYYNNISFNSGYGIVATPAVNLWIGNKCDSNNVALYALSNTTSQFRSASTTDTLTGNTFRYSNDRGIWSDDSSPILVGDRYTDGLNAIHDNPGGDIDATNYSYVTGIGNYVLNGVTLISSDATGTIDWFNEKMWDPVPTGARRGTATVTDTLRLAIDQRLNGDYSASFSLLKGMIDNNQGGAYAGAALRLLVSVLNDAEFIKPNNDWISKNIVTARNNFDTYLASLKSNALSEALKCIAWELLAHHKLVRRQFASADSLYDLFATAKPNTRWERLSLYGQVVARRMMADFAGAKLKSDLLRSKYPDEVIGVVAKVLIRDPLTDAERQMISKGTPSPIISSTSPMIPGEYFLYQNHPNPFKPSTNIAFRIPRREFVELAVFDALGRKIATLADGEHAEGFHTLPFDASRLPAAVYFYRLRSGNFTSVRKMILLK